MISLDSGVLEGFHALGLRIPACPDGFGQGAAGAQIFYLAVGGASRLKL